MAFDPLEPLKRDAEAIAASMVDWSPFEDDTPDEVKCGCGTVFYTHFKFVGPPLNKHLSRVPCPNCGARTNFRIDWRGWERG